MQITINHQLNWASACMPLVFFSPGTHIDINKKKNTFDIMKKKQEKNLDLFNLRFEYILWQVRSICQEKFSKFAAQIFTICAHRGTY